MNRFLMLLCLILSSSLSMACEQRESPTPQGDDDDDDLANTVNEEDLDGDGFCPSNQCEDLSLYGGDCDDENRLINPGATESCDTLDNDCDGRTDEPFDVDQDGFFDGLVPDCILNYPEEQLDCNDQLALINPAAEEACDGNDTNCNGLIDDGLDQDGDGYRICDVPADCNDEDASVFPNATELCDGADTNCNGFIDDGVGLEFADSDADGWSDCTGDCDDNDFTVNPGVMEACDEADNDCDGEVDEGLDNDGDGVPGAHPGCLAQFGAVDCDDDDPSLFPGAPEVCDSLDNNCDGQIDENLDFDGDGFSSCQGDCASLDASVFPGATEACDGIDNNCDGTIDEGFDNDGDGQSPCDGDCNDLLDTVYLGAPELCDGSDNDCDGQIGSNEVDQDGDGSSECDGDCDENNAEIGPAASEVCNAIDDDCDGIVPADELDNDLDGFVGCTPPGCSIALLNDGDDASFWSSMDALDATGMDTVQWDGVAASNVLIDVNNFSDHQVLVWYTTARSLSAAELSGLEQWLGLGGGLIVTGADALSNSSTFDPNGGSEALVDGSNLAALVRSQTWGNGPQTNSCVVNSSGNPIIDGPHGSWANGFTFSATDPNHEAAIADSSSGAIRVASVGNRAKLIFTELASGGSVLYWNGNAGLSDWSEANAPDMAAMLRNAVHHMNLGCAVMRGGDCDDTNPSLMPGTCL